MKCGVYIVYDKLFEYYTIYNKVLTCMPFRVGSLNKFILLTTTTTTTFVYSCSCSVTKYGNIFSVSHLIVTTELLIYIMYYIKLFKLLFVSLLKFLEFIPFTHLSSKCQTCSWMHVIYRSNASIIFPLTNWLNFN